MVLAETGECIVTEPNVELSEQNLALVTGSGVPSQAVLAEKVISDTLTNIANTVGSVVTALTGGGDLQNGREWSRAEVPAWLRIN
jgi:hypothetical protein